MLFKRMLVVNILGTSNVIGCKEPAFDTPVVNIYNIYLESEKIVFCKNTLWRPMPGNLFDIETEYKK